ncbi:LOW QUALITY PROTEIN: Reverse transcriptase [Phytophthora palmivora]|uniref:Reverse transcriptase n=1 Tax=Phytophthora palmivora TaxID=4796 RepID=A0A2P4X035_9STRA|nr:LOW QUALITY PROTEIN: Reverse transcriptase [Phytophthora palmivora]
MWLRGDWIPRIPGYVSVGLRRYADWQNLAYQTTADGNSEVDISEQIIDPAVERPVYVTSTILPRSVGVIKSVNNAEDKDVNLPPSKCTPDQGKIDPHKMNTGDPTMDDEICIQEGGILFAEDVEDQMAVLPEVTTTTEEVKIEDLQIGDAEINTQEEIEHLVQIIWKRKHVLIGKVNALPPAAKGVVCDIDVGNAKPVAQRCRKVAIQFREKLYQLIKGLLSARMIRHSTSPWASPIVAIIKKNGVDIQLYIDYHLVNSLVRLTVYPMPLINDLLDDLDKVLWYCSLDMASGFWVVPMTDRDRATSAFITPFERLLDNALYGFVKVTQDQDQSDRKDVFETGEPDLGRNESVLGRRSNIDDILVTGRSWDDLCEKVEKLLDACNEWNLPISVVKSFWDRQKVDYLGHRVSAEIHPNDLSALQELPFPTNLRSMQSFLGSLNYYSRFIEDFAIYASVLCEHHEADFYEITRRTESTDGAGNGIAEEGGRWNEAKTAFVILKNTIVTAPILRHFDVDRLPVVVVYTSKWVISATMMQEHDGLNEINYGIVDKKMLALLRILDICCTQLCSTLAWLLHSPGLQGRLGRWAALLSSWTLEIAKCTKGEDETLDVIAASITHRKEVDAILVSISPRKQPRQVISMPPPTVDSGEKPLRFSFDGSARVKRSGGAYSGIVLPDWTVISAASKYTLDLTVNETEPHGLLLCLDLLSDMDRGRLIICGDSNLVIRYMRAPGLILLRQQALERLRPWSNHEYLHMKRDWNQRADSLASAALRREDEVVIATDEERQDPMTLDRLDELLLAKNDAATVKITAVTRSRKKCRPQVLQVGIVQRMRMERINRAQGEKKWIVYLKAYLRGDVLDFTQAEAKSCSKIADRYETDESVLTKIATLWSSLSCPKHCKTILCTTIIRVWKVATKVLDGHTTRSELNSAGADYNRVHNAMWCINCETGKGRPTIHGESPGNLQATYPFQIIGMDHIPSLSRLHKGNAGLLIWIDLFTGYVIAKASSSRTAKTVAENYEECGFRRFGASEADMIENPYLCLTSPDRSTRSWDRDNEQRWRIAHKRTVQPKEWWGR